jgi:hypothetical protein
MNWKIELIGTRAAVAGQIVQRTDVPLSTALAKYISFAADPNPWVTLKAHGMDANIHSLHLEFFTPAPEAPTPVEPAPDSTPGIAG